MFLLRLWVMFPDTSSSTGVFLNML